MNLGNKILELRKNAKLSQEQLAEKLNVTRQTISKWELNETTPDIKQAQALSKIFKVSLDELVDNDIQNILAEKVSNTEKLAGIIIKILKVIGILFIIYVVFLVVALVLFITLRSNKEPSVSDYTEVSMNCGQDNNSYNIIMDTNKNYICENCSDDLNNNIKNLKF